MTQPPAPRRCGLFLPGHEVHHIQALHSANDHENRPVPGSLLAVDDDGEMEVKVDGQVHRFWNHDPARLRAVASAAGDRVELQMRWGTLRVHHPGGRFIFHVATGSHRPCPTTPPSGTILDLLLTAGGFSVSGADLQAWADDRSHVRP